MILIRCFIVFIYNFNVVAFFHVISLDTDLMESFIEPFEMKMHNSLRNTMLPNDLMDKLAYVPEEG